MTKLSLILFNRLLYLTIVLVFVCNPFFSVVSAQTTDEQTQSPELRNYCTEHNLSPEACIEQLRAITSFVDPFGGSCALPSGAGSTGELDNLDYKGEEIFNAARKQAIEENRPFYETAASQSQVPWQVLAVIHLRETGLGRANPSNGQGVYQFVNGDGGPYPTGPVSDQEFQRQTNFMAERVKNDFANRTEVTENRDLSSGNPNAVKDMFFSYNGRASAYKQQAGRLGYDAVREGYEGSPYVMNIFDPPRDPEVSPSTWGQIKTDGGGLSYPANSDHGAFIYYSALAGLGGGFGCNGSLDNLAITIVELARRELQTGANEADGSYLKYTGGVHAQWCAYFVSWILNEAGRPFESGPIPAVASILAYARANNTFYEPTQPGFTPQPGDIAIYKEEVGSFPSHVNIVVSYDQEEGTYVAIGGNETNTIRELTHSMSSISLTGFMRVAQ